MTTVSIVPHEVRPLLTQLLAAHQSGAPLALSPELMRTAVPWIRQALTDRDCLRQHARLVAQLAAGEPVAVEPFDAERAVAVAQHGPGVLTESEVALLLLSPVDLGDLARLASDFAADWWADASEVYGRRIAEENGIDLRAVPPEPPSRPVSRRRWRAAVAVAALAAALLVAVVAFRRPAPKPTDGPPAPGQRLDLPQVRNPSKTGRNEVVRADVEPTGFAKTLGTDWQDGDGFRVSAEIKTALALGVLVRCDSRSVEPLGEFEQTGGVVTVGRDGKLGTNRGRELFVLVLTSDPADAAKLKRLTADHYQRMQKAAPEDLVRVVRECFGEVLASGEKPWPGSPDDIVFLKVLIHQS